MTTNTRTKLTRWVAGALLAALPILAAAQAPAAPGTDKGVSRSKVERKNLAPVSNEILRVKLPKPVEATLSNGLTVLIMEDHRFPMISAQVYIAGAGPIYEPAEMPGLANAAAAVLREGTRTRNSKQIAEDVDKLGATLMASSNFGSDAATVSANGLSENFEHWFALLADVLINPSFPADEVGKWKQRQLASLRQQRTQPSFLANERFARAVYGKHPAAVVSATEASVQAITPEQLAKWHASTYVPQNAILGIAGDVNPKQLVGKLEKWLAAWKKTAAKAVVPGTTAAATAKKIYLVNRPDSVQTTFALGNIAIDRRSPDYPAMTVMNRVVGGGAAARLFLNLREEKGYTYGVYSNFNATKYAGPWRAFGDVRSEVTEGALHEFLYEIDRIRKEVVPASELEDAKRATVASFALSLERPAELLNYAITQKIYGLPADYWDTYPARIMAVTAADVQAVATKYLSPEALQVVAVGDAGKIKTVLEKYGPVEVYDVQGNAVPVTTAAEPTGK